MLIVIPEGWAFWNYELISAVHAPAFADSERLDLAALAKTEPEAQRHRLEMFGENLDVLHHNLRQAGLLDDPARSIFSRDDEPSHQVSGRHGVFIRAVSNQRQTIPRPDLEGRVARRLNGNDST